LSKRSEGIRKSFMRYRVMAFTTGVLIIPLFLISLPAHYVFHYTGTFSGPLAFLGILHGFLFPVYLLTALDLGVRLRWPWIKLALRMLAGTVPFAAFFVEAKAHREVDALLNAPSHPLERSQSEPLT
jgi:integral membrane protein